jgi:hypothetical protein
MSMAIVHRELPVSPSVDPSSAMQRRGSDLLHTGVPHKEGAPAAAIGIVVAARAQL